MTQAEFIDPEATTVPTSELDASTVAETPQAKAQEVKRLPWRVLLVDGGITLALAWAAYRGALAWEVLAGWVSTVWVAQAAPRGPAVETAVRSLGEALPKLLRRK